MKNSTTRKQERDKAATSDDALRQDAFDVEGHIAKLLVELGLPDFIVAAITAKRTPFEILDTLMKLRVAMFEGYQDHYAFLARACEKGYEGVTDDRRDMAKIVRDFNVWASFGCASLFDQYAECRRITELAE